MQSVVPPDGKTSTRKASMDESNTLVGEFMCQGKMQQAVRDRYVKMKAQPDVADLENLRQEILK